MHYATRSSRLAAVLLALVVAAPVARAVESPVGKTTTKEGGEQLLAALRPIADFRLMDRMYETYAFGLFDKMGQHVGDLGVHLDGELVTRFRTQHYTIDIGNVSADPTVVDTLVRGAQAIAATDGGQLPPEGIKMPPQPTRELWVNVLIAMLFAVGIGIARRGKITTDFRKVHAIQFITQSSLFLYWGLYWRGVPMQVPVIILHLALAYSVDAAFAFARFGSWRVGLSPVPVTLSINLFEWFDPHAAVIGIIGAFACKTLVRRGQSHIFNPSVAGLTIVGLVSILKPDYVHFGGLFHTFNLAPNMAEWVIVASLLPQTRFRILPVTIAATAALALTGNPAVTRPTILLAFTLLATDPVTTPASELGKVIFGVFIGVMLPQASKLFILLHQPDDFAKILSVSLGNLLVPQMEWLATQMKRGLAMGWQRVSELAPKLASSSVAEWAVMRLKTPLPNLALVGIWAVLVVPLVAAEKARDFEPALHWNWNTPLIVRDADDVPRCANNPVFCKPFSFPSEIAMWLKGGPAQVAPMTVGAVDEAK